MKDKIMPFLIKSAVVIGFILLSLILSSTHKEHEINYDEYTVVGKEIVEHLLTNPSRFIMVKNTLTGEMNKYYGDETFYYSIEIGDLIMMDLKEFKYYLKENK